MQLLYIWVEEYKSLKDFGINLSSQYKINYDKNSNKLDVEEKKGDHQIFTSIADGYPCINDLVAIVGKNGTGKTSIINLLCDLDSKIPDNIIVVYLEDAKLFYYSYINDIDVSNTFNRTKRKESQIIIYSALFDANLLFENDSKVIDITTNRYISVASNNSCTEKTTLFMSYGTKKTTLFDSYKSAYISDYIKLLNSEFRPKIADKMQFSVVIEKCSCSNVSDHIYTFLQDLRIDALEDMSINYEVFSFLFESVIFFTTTFEDNKWIPAAPEIVKDYRFLDRLKTIVKKVRELKNASAIDKLSLVSKIICKQVSMQRRWRSFLGHRVKPLPN